MIPRNVLGVGGGGSFPLAGKEINIVFNTESALTIPGFNYETMGDSSDSSFNLLPNVVPNFWDTDADPTFKVFGFSDGDNVGDYRFRYEIAAKEDGDTWGTMEQDVTETFAAQDGNDEAKLYEFATKVDKAILTPGRPIGVRVSRMGADVLDTRTGSFHMTICVISFPILSS